MEHSSSGTAGSWERSFSIRGTSGTLVLLRLQSAVQLGEVNPQSSTRSLFIQLHMILPGPLISCFLLEPASVGPVLCSRPRLRHPDSDCDLGGVLSA